MKICFPVESDKGLDSEVFGHFGSAPIFVVFDTETKSTDTINNQDLVSSQACNVVQSVI